ncbi:dUTP diphosphatase [Natronincola ferrireducens]|uniref:Dimeric dUTPase, all-alpha-NTP-PPase (MazG) superfamily n=1 Tax=Natronincola ferrireducens TaxID=393762 RepID=A0A1G9I3I2_9FIRM|nr:dUTP diphosphatase [Natronincola ferrireducens]SDL19642.1 Dimeric dUTPase, all-alpha-NTP-PPase (MazG) superfamily [Natronincola ferrireducens]
MDLDKLYAMQKELDRHIIQEKGLEGQDLLTNSVLALQVEIGELANELPEFFKHWSNKKNNYDNALKEYVDCLHFFLSIANQLGLEDGDLFTHDDDLIGTTARIFTELLHHVGKIELSETRNLKVSNYKAAFFIFANLGVDRLGLDWQEICKAYVKKNIINHQRQIEGY